MTYNNAELEELVREQIALQLKFDSNSGRIKDRTIRQRSIRDYEIELFRKNPDIYVVFEGEKELISCLMV